MFLPPVVNWALLPFLHELFFLLNEIAFPRRTEGIPVPVNSALVFRKDAVLQFPTFSMRPGESKETHGSHSASDSYKCVSGTHGRHWSQKEYLDVARELQRLVISIFNIEYRNTCCRKPKIGNSIIDATICTPTSGRKCPSCCGARILPWKKICGGTKWVVVRFEIPITDTKKRRVRKWNQLSEHHLQQLI